MADPVAPQANLGIDGEPPPAPSGRYDPVLNPATGEVIARVAEGGPEDVGAAVAAARRSFETGEWRRARSSERARGLLRLAGENPAPGQELAEPGTAQPGQPLPEAP